MEAHFVGRQVVRVERDLHENASQGLSEYRRFRSLKPNLKISNIQAVEKRKRFLDLLLLLLAMYLVLPLFLVISLAVKIGSKGPIIYKQKRYGRDGKPFYMLKFRTMVPDAEALRDSLAHLNEVTGPEFKMTNDPRITRVGKFLRRTSLDEVPQLLNVLRGDMSLIGPRASSIPPQNYEPWQLDRLKVRPGIAGPAQIWSRHGSFEEKCDLDIEYIGSMSLRTDIFLLFKLTKKLLTSADGK